MNYKNAFKCHKCPERNDEKGCPMWWEFMETNIQSGEERLVKMCGFAAMPRFLTETMKASNRDAAAMESTRNLISSSLQQIALSRSGNAPLQISEDRD